MHAGVAQLVERRFCTPGVAGSNPVTSSNPTKDKVLFAGLFVARCLCAASGWDSVLFVCCRVHMPLSINGDAFGEDGSSPSVVYV